MWASIVFGGVIMAAGTLLVLDGSLPGGLVEGTGDMRYAQTMAFTTLLFFSLFTVFNARSDHESAFRGMFGAAMNTTSTAGSSTTARQSAAARVNPNEATASSRRSGSVSPHTTRSVSKPRPGNSVGRRSSDRLWAWPSQPKPMTPTPIRRRGEGGAAKAQTLSVAALPTTPDRLDSG